jgi:glucose-1-phosphate cytidylyltransferase
MMMGGNMKVVLLAGGLGTRLSEETVVKPKPMVEIGGRPILWHIMKLYSQGGFKDFIVCLGYKGYYIKEWFANYFLHNSDITINLKNNKMQIHDTHGEDWNITLVDTGYRTMTGGRVKKIEKYIEDDRFMLTYGDGLTDMDMNTLIKYHKEKKRIATLTSVQPPGRFGSIETENGIVKVFQEKPKGDKSWINAGFFVMEKTVFDYIENKEDEILERSPLERLCADNQLSAYRHHGFWKPMDTLRDKVALNEMWDNGKAPWKTW